MRDHAAWTPIHHRTIPVHTAGLHYKAFLGFCEFGVFVGNINESFEGDVKIVNLHSGEFYQYYAHSILLKVNRFKFSSLSVCHIFLHLNDKFSILNR